MEMQSCINMVWIVQWLLLTSALPNSDAIDLYPDHINVTKLILLYERVCGGDMLCNTQTSGSTVNSTFTQTLVKAECKPCSCDVRCIITGTCCIDVAPNTCRNLQYYPNHTNPATGISYFVIDNCPSGTSGDLQSMCNQTTTPDNFLDVYPVTSEVTSLSYINKYCAECYNESTVIPWDVDTECKLNFDINVLSTTEEIWNSLVDNDCIVNYSPLQLHSHPPTQCDETDRISVCNTTGLWDQYDPDISWACQNIYDPYREFRNVFCFMCNSGLTSDEALVSECNATGVMKSVDQTFEESCTNAPIDTIAFPYKNKFCQSCNIEKGEEGYLVLSDSVIKIFSENVYFDYRFGISYMINYLKELSENLLKVSQNERTSNKTENGKDIETLNISNLEKKYGVVFSGCNNQSSFSDIGNSIVIYCSCNISCISDRNCCPDYASSLPISCENVAHKMGNGGSDNGAPDNSYVLVGRCPDNYSNTEIMSRCENSNFYDMYSIIPLEVSSIGVSYKNVYCFLCNTEDSVHGEPFGYSNITKFWSMDIMCPTFIDVKHMPSLQRTIDFAFHRDCTVNFLPSSLAMPCEIGGIDRCNVTGLKSTVEHDLKYLCEGSIYSILPSGMNPLFRNILCELCNSENIFDTVAVCNVSGNADPYGPETQLGCVNGGSNAYYFPYSNEFCLTCNQITEMEGQPSIPSSYRKLFSTAGIDSASTHGKIYNILSQGDCPDGQVYDPYQDLCRTVYCSPGKYFNNGVCTLLITQASNLRYNIGFEIEMDINENTVDKAEILLRSSASFDMIVKSHLQVDTALTEVYFVEYNLPCWTADTSLTGSKYVSNGFEFKMLVYMRIWIHNAVDRYELESKLVNLTLSKVTVTFPAYYDRNFTFSLKKQPLAWLLPLQSGEHFRKEQCFVSGIESSGTGAYMYTKRDNTMYVADATELLLCPQIELQSDEFSTQENDLTIHVDAVGKTFQFYDFIRSPDKGAVRICLNDYIAEKEDMTELEIALTVFTYICTCVSLLCLLASFLVYVKFPSLRTLPGMNIMALVVSLFCAQFTFLFGSINVNYTFCITIGILMHFFWLSTFSFTNVCSFHMFRVFALTSLTHQDSEDNKRTFTRYCVFACFFPVFFIVLNLVMHSTAIQGEGVGYGGEKCFMEDKYALIYTFILPFSGQMLANIFFFAVTLLKLRGRPKVQSTRTDHANLIIYIKLFSITGITWIFQLIDGLFPISLFSFVVTFLNGTQGLFIFMSYVCTKRVYVLLRSVLSPKSFKSVSSHTETENHSTSYENGKEMTSKTLSTRDNTEPGPATRL